MSTPHATQPTNGGLETVTTIARVAVLKNGQALLTRDSKRLPETVAADGRHVREAAVELAKSITKTDVDSEDLMHVFSSPHQSGYHICMYVLDCGSDDIDASLYEWCLVEALEGTCEDGVDALFGQCWMAGGGNTVKEFRTAIRSSLRVRNTQ
jgi:hypothetical protein